MTSIAPLITGFLREHMPIAQGCSPHTCETYAYALRLLLLFASKRLGIRPSQICLEQIDAALVPDSFFPILRNNAATAQPRATGGLPRSRPLSGTASSCRHPLWRKRGRSTRSSPKATITRR